MAFINTTRELLFGDGYFKEHIMIPGFDWRAHKKEISPFYERYGFKVSMMYNDFFSRRNGVFSDRYLSADLFYFYVLPCLNSYDLRPAYADKNMYSTFLSGLSMPEVIVKNMNGIFYSGSNECISSDVAIERLMRLKGEYMIKPTLLSCDGKGVELFDSTSQEAVVKQLNTYRENFVIQAKVRQHKDMCKLNQTSLNTLRMFTYRTVAKDIVILPFTMVRFGGKGTVIDNARAGGGFCTVGTDGWISDRLFKLYEFGLHSLKLDLGIERFRVPCWEKCVDFVLGAHDRLPYFDFIGWDIAVDEDNSPLMVEFNVDPSIELPQVGVGPMFGDYLEEVLGRISNPRRTIKTFAITTFKKNYNYMLQIGG